MYVKESTVSRVVLTTVCVEISISMPFLCCCPDVFGFTTRRRGDIDEDDDNGSGDTTDDADTRLADIVGSDEDEEDEDEDANARFGRHQRRRGRRRRTHVEGSLLGDAHRRERSDVMMEEEYDAMRRESSASAPPVGMRHAANAVTTTTTPRSGGSEAFYYDDDKGEKGTMMTTTTHRRSVSMAVVTGDDAGKIADAEVLATIKREFARTKSLSFDRRGGGDTLEDGLSSSKTTTMSKMMSDDYDATCPTCFEEYDEENPRITLGCGHHFHLPCVLEWREYLELQGREDTCPVCDAPIVLDGF